ncbi:MAG: exodeoxyribonuclease V alpha subunit, partial [Verrucomicrobia bacterium]
MSPVTAAAPFLALARATLGRSAHDTESACKVLAELLQAQAQGKASLILADEPLAHLRQSGHARLAHEDAEPATAVMVIDGSKVMLTRTHALQQSIRATVSGLLSKAQPSYADAEAGILAAFGPEGDGRDQGQRDAVRGLLKSPLAILTGGPGTGKTTTAATFLALSFALDHALDPEDVILAAPTGKAAKRLEQAIHDAALPAGRLGKSGLPCEKLLRLGAKTLHKTLAWTPKTPEQGGPFKHGKNAPLSARIVLIDEASMIDLSLFLHLLEALPTGAQLVILGDEDQLESVEIGGSLAELIKSHPAAVFRLSHCFRSESLDILELAQAFKPGATQRPLWSELQSLLQRPSLAFTTLSPFSQVLPAEAAAQLQADWEPFRRATATIDLDNPESQRLAFKALNAFQVLCAQNEGPGGVHEINSLAAGTGAPLSHGTPVMVTRNERQLDLANGDIGIVVQRNASDIARVVFPHRDPLPLAQLPAHEPAWAFTIHKSQGSEFLRCTIFLPPDTQSALLT